MSWVSEAIAGLAQNEAVTVTPIGGSMRGRVESGQPVTLEPVFFVDLEVGDVVLVRWKGNFLLHLITDIQGLMVQIGNNLGKINGWVPSTDVVGKMKES